MIHFHFVGATFCIERAAIGANAMIMRQVLRFAGDAFLFSLADCPCGDIFVVVVKSTTSTARQLLVGFVAVFCGVDQEAASADVPGHKRDES